MIGMGIQEANLVLISLQNVNQVQTKLMKNTYNAFRMMKQIIGRTAMDLAIRQDIPIRISYIYKYSYEVCESVRHESA